MDIVTLPSRSVPVLAEADICVAGGSCTGVFAAVTAARPDSSSRARAGSAS